MSPRGFVEEGWADSDINLSPLPSRVQDSLALLAEGQSQPLGQTIRDICDFLVSNDRADGTLEEALTFYVLNFCFA